MLLPPVKLDVCEMLRSGQTVNSAVTPSILAGIFASESEIKDLGHDISRLGALINQKKVRIATAKATLLEYRSAMAPIRTLPPELLLHIFTLANEDRVLLPSSFLSSRIRVGHVCKAWRSLSRASPSLWNDTSFAGNHWRPDLGHCGPKYIEQSLVLSCPRPLYISFAFPASYYLIDPHYPIISSTVT
ncbi:hypothetical protein CPB85DRAFT_614672 [Mucidula mucida]|nr:hypothetical protein CPB85DRAFT_614672 [Mucidula mucida]